MHDLEHQLLHGTYQFLTPWPQLYAQRPNVHIPIKQ